jgi:hypothetical protein
VFTGPPESVRDHVMAASRAMSRGDWGKAYAFITALKMWSLMPEKDEVLAMLQARARFPCLNHFCVVSLRLSAMIARRRCMCRESAWPQAGSVLPCFLALLALPCTYALSRLSWK